jgi:hypothetical protein
VIAIGTTSSSITERRRVQRRRDDREAAALGPRERPAERDRGDADRQRADHRRQALRGGRPRRQRDEGEHHRCGDREVLVDRADEVEPEAQEDARDHAHHDRHRCDRERPPHPAGQRERGDQHAGDDERAEHLGVAGVRERGADQHGARDRPEAHQRRAVAP